MGSSGPRRVGGQASPIRYLVRSGRGNSCRASCGQRLVPGGTQRGRGDSRGTRYTRSSNTCTELTSQSRTWRHGEKPHKVQQMCGHRTINPRRTPARGTQSMAHWCCCLRLPRSTPVLHTKDVPICSSSWRLGANSSTTASPMGQRSRARAVPGVAQAVTQASALVQAVSPPGSRSGSSINPSAQPTRVSEHGGPRSPRSTDVRGRGRAQRWTEALSPPPGIQARAKVSRAPNRRHTKMKWEETGHGHI